VDFFAAFLGAAFLAAFFLVAIALWAPSVIAPELKILALPLGAQKEREPT
jgi:hypothetical protein